jgi:hypothetical protein
LDLPLLYLFFHRIWVLCSIDYCQGFRNQYHFLTCSWVPW